jgi:hypothetical protein
MQPSSARWEKSSDSDERQVLGGTKTGNGAWALAWVDTVMEVAPPADDPGIVVKPPVPTPTPTPPPATPVAGPSA